MSDIQDRLWDTFCQGYSDDEAEDRCKVERRECIFTGQGWLCARHFKEAFYVPETL